MKPARALQCKSWRRKMRGEGHGFRQLVTGYGAIHEGKTRGSKLAVYGWERSAFIAFVQQTISQIATAAQVKPPLGVPGYLDPNHPRYSPKLSAAIKVWEAMEDENARDGKGPVVAMEKWLSDRWRELGLAHKGAINKTGVSEVARVANWKPEGGTPPTPSK